MQDYKTPRRYYRININDHGLDDDFLDTTPKAQSMKERID